MEKIKINGKNYPVKFGLSNIRRWAVANGMASINEFEGWLTGLNDGNFESLGQMASLFHNGLERGAAKSGTELDLDEDDLLDMAVSSPEIFEKLMLILVGSVQAGNVPGASQPDDNKKPAKKK